MQPDHRDDAPPSQTTRTTAALPSWTAGAPPPPRSGSCCRGRGTPPSSGHSTPWQRPSPSRRPRGSSTLTKCQGRTGVMIFVGFLGCSSGDSTIFEPDMQLILPWNRLIPKSNPQRLWVGRFSVVLIFVQVLCEFVCLLIVISGMRVNLKKDALVSNNAFVTITLTISYVSTVLTG